MLLVLQMPLLPISGHSRSMAVIQIVREDPVASAIRVFYVSPIGCEGKKRMCLALN